MSLEPAATYHHVDVFAGGGYSGNSLPVFVDPPALTARQMLTITRELRHFETIFVTRGASAGEVTARVFDLIEELDFAGHPVLGAAAVLHALDGIAGGRLARWTFTLPAGAVRVTTRRGSDGPIAARLETGRPEPLGRPAAADRPSIAAALGLAAADLDAALPAEVWSTGLRYLVVPVEGGDALARARISHPDFEGFLKERGAQFAYVLDAGGREGRHWNNDGVLEDVATGSAAGCVAAYLMRHGRARDGEESRLSQGRFAGRPSSIAITAYGTPDSVERVTVGGDVVLMGTGTLATLPE